MADSMQFYAPPPPQFAPAQFAPRPNIGAQGMALLNAALKGRPQVASNPNAPVNPGTPPPAGDPAYFPGGQGPMAGGPAQSNGLPQMMQMGLLAKLLGGGQGGLMGGGLNTAPAAMPEIGAYGS